MVLKSLVYLGYLLQKWSQNEMPLVLGLSGVFGTGYPSGSGPRVTVPGYYFRFQYILSIVPTYHNSDSQLAYMWYDAYPRKLNYCTTLHCSTMH